MQFSILVILSTLFTASLAALSTADITSVFPSSASLTGTSTTTDAFTLTLVANSTYALISLSTTSSSQIGWWAVGTGTQMSDSDLLVAYPTAGTWTLSHRVASGHRAPSILSGTSDHFTLVESLSNTQQITFLRPLNLAASPGFTTTSKFTQLETKAGQQLVWAAGSKNPGSATENAPITFHDIGQGSLTLDLSKALEVSSTGNGNGTTPVVSQKAGSNVPWTKRDSIIVAHAVFGILAWLIFAPLGALIGRWAREKKEWVAWHQGVQLGGTGLCTVIAVALGIGAVQVAGGDHWVGKHKTVGLALAILMVAQITLGEVNHFLYQKWAQKNAELTMPAIRVRPWNNYLHIILGITLLILGYVQLHLGLSLYTRTPSFLPILLYVLIGLQVFIYLAGFLRSQLVKRRRPASSQSFASGGDEEKFAVNPAGLTTPGGSLVDLPKLPQSQPLGSLHEQAKYNAGLMGTERGQQRSDIGPYASYSNIDRQPSNIQSNHPTQQQFQLQAPPGPKVRDFARPPYVGGAYNPVMHGRNNVGGGGGGATYTQSNGPVRHELKRAPSKNGVGMTVHAARGQGPMFVHHRGESGSSTGSDPRFGLGGMTEDYRSQRIELAGDWKKKGHARVGSLKRRSVSMSAGHSSEEGTSSVGHGI